MFQVTAAASALGRRVLTGIHFNAIHTFMGGPIRIGDCGDHPGGMGYPGPCWWTDLGFSGSVAYLSSDFRDAISFGLLFIILLIRPAGIFGKNGERKG